MGKVAVLDHEGAKITLSMIKFGLSKRMLFCVARKLRLIDRYSFAIFTPKYEIAVFRGIPKGVLSKAVFVSMPDVIFYYPDADTAARKWGDLATAIEQGGLLGAALLRFMSDAHPSEQGQNILGLYRP
jgi:hypothetical protein